jgi:hypothetical protein
MAIQQASEHALARQVAQDLATLVDEAVTPSESVDINRSLLAAQDRLSEYEWVAPIAGSKCLYATSLRTGQRYRVVVKPLRAGDDGDE